MKVATSDKNIPTGSFYVKFKNFYIYDNKPVILEYLTDLFKQRNSPVYILELKGKYYVFKISGNSLEIFTRDNIDDVILEYPNAVVKQDRYLKKIKPKVKGIRIDKKQLALFVILSVFIVLGFVFVKKKKREEEIAKNQIQQIKEISQQQTQPQPQCFSNVKHFALNYVPYIEVENEVAYIVINDTRYDVPLNREPAEPVSVNTIYITSADYQQTNTEEGYKISIDDYYKCLEFIERNKDIPLIIRRLNYEKKENNTYACDFIINWDCISTTTNTTSPTTSPATTTNTTTNTQ